MAAHVPLDLLHKLALHIRTRGDPELLLRLDRLIDISDEATREQLLAAITLELKTRKS